MKLQLPVNPIDALVIAGHALDVPQVKKTQSKAPATVRIGQPEQPVRDERILLAELLLVTIAGLRDREKPTGSPDRYPLGNHNVDRDLLARRSLQYFPAKASRKISASICDSAYIFFSRRFSSSSSFGRFMSDTCIPPHFDRQL